MYAIVGAAGKVGYATAAALREAGVSVKAIVRDESKSTRLRAIGCEIAVADLYDHQALAEAIGSAESVQVIIPPSPQAKDLAAEMLRAIESIGLALEAAHPKRLLAISDYGAHVTHDIGMPTMLGRFEKRMAQINGHKVVLRSAEHMENWGRVLAPTMASSTLATFYDPADIQLPTISASDLGLIAAGLLLQPVRGDCVQVVHAEGPRRYSAKDVAAALSLLSRQTIGVQVIPRPAWAGILEQLMSPTMADLLIKANDAQNQRGLIDVEPNAKEVKYGKTELVDALRPLL